MKRLGGRVSESQLEFLNYLPQVGFASDVCYFWQNAAWLIVAHLGLHKYAPIGEPEWTATQRRLAAAKAKSKSAKAVKPRRKTIAPA